MMHLREGLWGRVYVRMHTKRRRILKVNIDQIINHYAVGSE